MVDRYDAMAGAPRMLLGRVGRPTGTDRRTGRPTETDRASGRGRRVTEARRSLLGRTERIDPLDALFRLAAQGQAPADRIRLALSRARFEVAVDGAGRPLVGRFPDGVACLAVATSVAHRERVAAAGWCRIDLPDLVCLLPDRVDVLFNPAGPVPFRLAGDFVRDALLTSDTPPADDTAHTDPAATDRSVAELGGGALVGGELAG
jgi:hypothetical protein